MTNQSQALQLADLIDKVPYRGTHEAAAELRRLHAENETLHKRIEEAIGDMKSLLVQRDDLLSTLNKLRGYLDPAMGIADAQMIDIIDSAITRTQGGAA